MIELNRKLDLLLIDDDPDDKYLLNQALNKVTDNINLLWVDSGLQLKQYVAECESTLNYPDLIFLDLNLPAMSGMQILKWIKQSTACHSIPVIIYTTSQSERDIAEAYNLGANSYVVKQGTLKEIVSTISSIVNYWTRIVKLPN